MQTPTINPPPGSSSIEIFNGQLKVPECPVIPFIEGDGSGADIWRAARRVLDSAVESAYAGRRRLAWSEVFAGQKAFDRFSTWLPEETLDAFSRYKVGLKGPLTTPIGEGMRSLNVALRQSLDLYVCLRPVRWFAGVPAPVRHPERVDMVIFRENTEDIYTGIEFPAGSSENKKFLEMLKTEFPESYRRMRFTDEVGLNLKPVSRAGSERLVRAAIRWALAHQRRSVTLVHKGNIMKYTEGAFRGWGYALAESEFGSQVYTQLQWERTRKADGEIVADNERVRAISSGRLWIKDIITDAAFDQTLTHPEDYDVLATTNLNGDYLSDALAAQVGGIGIAPGANINYETGVAVFEATHGTAPLLAGKDAANPCSVILSGEMMLRYLGWTEAADLVLLAIGKVIAFRRLTADLHHLTEGAALLKTSEFADALIETMHE